MNAWHVAGFYEFDRNGERFVIECFAAVYGKSESTVWDVGAHKGEYALACHEVLPRAKVISFEIIPDLARTLAGDQFHSGWFESHNFGLSDKPGQAEVNWHHGSDSTNSIHKQDRSGLAFYGEIETISCPVTTIDELIGDGLPPPDFLKVDVEGHDAFVLDGGRKLFQSNAAPKLIQFEYGGTWIPANRTLYSVQVFLEECGYWVGRLYPDHVAFKTYEFADDRFRMGNMVATRCVELKKLLAG